MDTATVTFTEFVGEVGGRVRSTLIAGFGPNVGADAAAEALAYGWEHWDRIGAMDNPAGYLYKVGRSRARRILRRNRPVALPPPPMSPPAPWVEPALPKVLARLPDRQRAAVVLVHGYGWTLEETGQVLGVSRSTVQRHVDRALTKLRDALEVDRDA